MKSLLTLISILVLANTPVAFSAECKGDVQTVTQGKLTVAAYDYPPFSIASPDGQISGIDAAVVKRMAADNCLEVVTLVTDPAATVQAVVANKADVAIGSWNRTEKRTKVLGLSAPLYLDHMGIYSKAGYDSLEATIGHQAGTVSGFFWVPDLQKLFGANLKLYPTPVAMGQDLATGRIDVGFLGYNTGIFNQRNNGAYKGIEIKMATPDERVNASVLPPQISILYTKGNESLGQALDASIKIQHEDRSMAKSISDAGFDTSILDVGEPRLVK
ncbi:transporter substrate-binding domain-containing protein [Rhizobium sp. NZLR1b]|jgi:polar amino acid transport system substrate-binding protein|uniref:substrate-binding periplasmic protein n=1 Tax=unclassified Rhizobium TaxID=2613769 RepID=UPI001C82980E|nr:MULTISPECIES: transporter substrate-binding domain-containing protein [unclassified Rhizobium]MBX5173366.1 transporter substrate-binding domain-containing protein [Rhizobium sp. NZLR1b]MBX5192566.1 transporter substrate-binding domain-containing protein [Rhizobium sp. NZLR3b]